MQFLEIHWRIEIIFKIIIKHFEINFSIWLPIKSWYAIKQIN